MTASVTSLRTETPRTAIRLVDESTTDDAAAVVVTLHWDGSDHVGESSGPPAAAHRPLLVAQATLRALEEAGMRHFEAIEATVTGTAGVAVAIVAVEDPILGKPLIGTAVISDDVAQVAFARAALDAVNRRVDSDH